MVHKLDRDISLGTRNSVDACDDVFTLNDLLKMRNLEWEGVNGERIRSL